MRILYSPHPQPLSHSVGEVEPRAGVFGVLKRKLQHRAEASLPHSIVALARLGGEGNTARLF